jgi:short-subunit dehydrogenase
MTETALVTGASSGIGEQFARQLSDRGYRLVLVARRTDRLEQIAAQLPTQADVIGCDLAREAADLPARVEALDGAIDLLVNNAGFGHRGRFLESDAAKDAEMVRVNCEAVVILTRAFLPAMVERGRGGVINIGSVSGLQPLPYSATYAAAKMFVRAFTDGLHAELRGTGVSALAVNPGPVPTEWQEIAGEHRRVPGGIPAEQVVREALDAFERGRRSLIPGAVPRLLYNVSRAAPRPLLLRVTERMYRPRG